MNCFVVSLSRVDNFEVSVDRIDAYIAFAERHDSYTSNTVRVCKFDVRAAYSCDVIAKDISMTGSYVFNDETVVIFDDDTQVLFGDSLES